MHYTKLLPLVLAGACALPAPPPPTAEFLVSAGDQTYWVQSSKAGLHIRSSPLILAHTAGRYYEVFVVEVDRSFPRGLFSGERVYRRELASDDSAMIFDDTTVIQLAARYHRAHPAEPLLGPDDDPEDNIEISAVGETDILSVLGPYVALEHRLSIERPDEDESDDTTRVVVDIRNGRRVGLDHMLGDSAVQEAAGEGGLVNRRWKHGLYDVVSRYDSAHQANSLVMRDRGGREWRLGVVGSSFVQIYWLDKPKLDPKTRHALARAFNDATTYGQTIQQVTNRRPRGDHRARLQQAAKRRPAAKAPIAGRQQT